MVVLDAVHQIQAEQAGEIASLFRLNLMHGVEDHHAVGDFRGVVAELSFPFFPAPDAKRRCCHYFISSMICRKSSRMSGMGSRVSRISPAEFLRATILKSPNFSSLAGKSSRK